MTPFSVPVMVADVTDATPVVVIGKVAVVAPARTVTAAGEGRVAFVLLDVRVTVAPPDGAIPFRVTVPVEELPPISEVGETDTAVRAAGLIVSVSGIETLPWLAVIVAGVALATAVVLMIAVADVVPARTVI